MIDTLLAPISADAPCGPDLEYDADFLALQRSAAGKPDEQYGETRIAAQPPAWRDVERIALALLARTKDLRVVVPLTYAWIDSRGLEGYADGLRLATSLLDTYWEPLYPMLAVDGTPDPLPRFNVLAELAGPQGCARAARERPLLGALSVSAALDVLQQGEGADGGHADTYAGGRERLVREWRDALESASPALHAGLTIREQLAHLRRIVGERLGDAWTLDASALERQLATLAAALPSRRTTEAAQAAAPGAGGQEPQPMSQQRGAAPPPAAGTANGANGAAWRDAEISSRSDIDFGLEKMCRYFELHEPSHPAPIFLRRAQRLLSLNFYEIFRDIAPESVRELDHLSGHRNESPQ
ncbi:type VI secretion system protein TssA [Paraburkholderia sp. EG287A]|uniref:type VI secretion system protein TssA n=1 Tax=unclassified Paraburkholderia TaxID=2615204 RepID=UPI0034D34D81